jgi:hypothetical protein
MEPPGGFLVEVKSPEIGSSPCTEMGVGFPISPEQVRRIEVVMKIAIATILLASFSYLVKGPCSVTGWCRTGENENIKSYLKVLHRNGHQVSARVKYTYKRDTTFSRQGDSDEMQLTFDCEEHRVFYHASHVWEDIFRGSLSEADMKHACRM